MKRYYWHPCGDRHTTWLDLGRCIWAHGVVVGDGPYAAASCGARDVILYPTVEQARARKRGLDRHGCRPSCYRRHHVILIEGALDNGKPSATVTRRATTPAAPTPPKPDRPICGRPRTNGEPCHRPPGWGADPGEKHCRDHGGSVTERLAAKERLVEQALTFAQLTTKALTTPLTAEEQTQAEESARAVLTARKGRRSPSAVNLAGWPFSAPVVEVAALTSRWLRLLDPPAQEAGAGRSVTPVEES